MGRQCTYPNILKEAWILFEKDFGADEIVYRRNGLKFCQRWICSLDYHLFDASIYFSDDGRVNSYVVGDNIPFRNFEEWLEAAKTFMPDRRFPKDDKI